MPRPEDAGRSSGSVRGPGVGVEDAGAVGVVSGQGRARGAASTLRAGLAADEGCRAVRLREDRPGVALREGPSGEAGVVAAVVVDSSPSPLRKAFLIDVRV